MSGKPSKYYGCWKTTTVLAIRIMQFGIEIEIWNLLCIAIGEIHQNINSKHYLLTMINTSFSIGTSVSVSSCRKGSLQMKEKLRLCYFDRVSLLKLSGFIYRRGLHN